MTKNKKESREEVNQYDGPHWERRSVWVTPKINMPFVNYKNPKGHLANFKWDEFANDRERIKQYTKRFKDLSVVEAFEKTYGERKISQQVREQANIVPTDLTVGQIVPMKILTIAKNGIVFDNTITKQNVTSSINLHKYAKLRDNVPNEPIKVKVLSATKDRIQVDPLSPMFEDWIKPYLEDAGKQNVDSQDKIQSITIKNLRLVRGGYEGKAVIPTLTDFVGSEYTVDAFIPGGQIVLNIENDFEKWNGQTVQAYITTYSPKPNSIGQMSLICSRKEMLKNIGDINVIRLFKYWCENGDLWKNASSMVREGVVTGIINSSKKCGAFIELPDLNITGILPLKPEQLGDYKPQQKVLVKLTDFEENTYYDSALKQNIHEDPYKIEDGVIRECNIKPILSIA